MPGLSSVMVTMLCKVFIILCIRVVFSLHAIHGNHEKDGLTRTFEYWMHESHMFFYMKWMLDEILWTLISK